ncbi:MAG: hypothetical protein ACPHSD_18895 [Candidatus Latescibacterota bacterium]
MMSRAGRIPAEGAGHKHSYLTQRLYAEILEAEMLLNAGLQQVVAWGALHAHPNADFEAATKQLGSHYVDALSRIPYLTGGQTGEGSLQADRQAFYERYKEYKAKVLQGRQPRPKRDRMAGIKQIGKK